MDKQVLTVLIQIAEQVGVLGDRLEHLEKALSQEHLGFGEAPVVRTVHCNRGHGSCWYFWDGARKQPIPIPDESITGYIVSVDLKQGEFRGKPNDHVRLILDCGGKRYRLQSGLETLFSRQLIADLAVAGEALRGGLLTVIPRPGDDENVLFCSTMLNKSGIMRPEGFYARPEEWSVEQLRQVLDRVIAAVGGQVDHQGEAPTRRTVKPQSPAPDLVLTSPPASPLDEPKTTLDPIIQRIRMAPDLEALQAIEALLAHPPYAPKLSQNPALGEQIRSLISARRRDLAASPPVDLSDVFAQISVDLDRLGWTPAKGKAHLQRYYNGKTSRSQLTDDELIQFSQWLAQQPSPAPAH